MVQMTSSVDMQIHKFSNSTFILELYSQLNNSHFMHNMKFIEIALKAVLFQRKKTVCFMILDPLKVYFIYPHLASIVLQYYFCACFVLLRAILAHA